MRTALETSILRASVITPEQRGELAGDIESITAVAEMTGRLARDLSAAKTIGELAEVMTVAIRAIDLLQVGPRMPLAPVLLLAADLSSRTKADAPYSGAERHRVAMDNFFGAK